MPLYLASALFLDEFLSFKQVEASAYAVVLFCAPQDLLLVDD
jgi:hypothetical protein